MLNLNQRMHSFFHNMISSPSHPFHFVWSSIVCLIVIYFILQIIFVSCFDSFEVQHDPALKIIHAIFCAVLVVDMPLNLLKVYPYNEFGNYQFKNIAYKYLRSKFAVDIISVITLLLTLTIDNQAAMYLRFSMLMRIWDLFILQKIIFKKLLHRHFLREFFTISKIFMFELFVIHCASCVFYLIGRLLIKYQYYGNSVANSELYWLTTSVVSSPIIELSVFEQYLWSFYFGAGVISTIVIGDIVGHNPIETGFIFVMIFIGTISQAYLFEVIVEAWGASYERIKDYLKNLQITTNFLRSNDIPNSLQHEVQSYLQYRWLQQHHQNNQQQKRILSKLPKSLKSMITLNQFSKQLNTIKVFNLISPSSTIYSQIIQSFNESYYFKDQILINSFNEESLLFLVSKGTTVEYFRYSPISDLIPNNYYTSDKILGMEKFMTGMMGKRIIKAKTRISALKVQRQVFASIIKNSRSVYEQFQETNHSIAYNNNYQKINHQCQCCEQYSHNVINCEECHISKTVNESLVQNQRMKKSRNRLTRSRKGSSTINFTNIDDLFSIKDMKKSQKRGQIQKYIQKSWQKLHSIIENKQQPNTKPYIKNEKYQPFQKFKIYQNYYPQYNIVSDSN